MKLTKEQQENLQKIFTQKQILEKDLYFFELGFNKIKNKYYVVKNRRKDLNLSLDKIKNNFWLEEDEALQILETKITKYLQELKELKIKYYESLSIDDKKETINLKAEVEYRTKYIEKKETLLRQRKKENNVLNKLTISKIELKLSFLDSKYKNVKKDFLEEKSKLNSKRNKLQILAKKYENILPDSGREIVLDVKELNVWYGTKHALKDISISFPRNKVIAIIGPSGCGKSTFLKTLNRINDEIPSFRSEGQIIIDKEINSLTLKSIYNPLNKITLPQLRTKIGMVFQQPNPFPISIYKNVIFGPKINGIKNKFILENIAIKSLKEAALYNEVKNNLNELATGLSGGQQQRLCIARAIANNPEILLMDEPTSALDPIAASKVENLIIQLKKHYTIIMVTHSMQQAARISDKTAFFYQGSLIEYGDTNLLFENPKQKKTEDYIRGRFG
ncbi:MAG: phosphate ABC transporter ATP-binding protein [Mycoplasmataceae bacterium]|nr:phosphate ABC transporter ATP-binding protein [Mycoplasmataceae bacterium]